MKKYSVFYVIVLFSLIFIGCSKDETPEYFTVVGTVLKTGDSTLVVTDSDERLLINNSGAAGSVIENNDRVIIYFTILDETPPQGIDYVVDLYDVEKVLYKPVIELTDEIEDSIGFDPLIVKDIWIAKKYMNINFSYYGNNKTHYINMTRDQGAITNDTIVLDLRHNANDDQQAYTINGFVSFDLESLQQEALDSVVLRVKALEYDGHQYDKFFVYRY